MILENLRITNGICQKSKSRGRKFKTRLDTKRVFKMADYHEPNDELPKWEYYQEDEQNCVNVSR